MLIAPNGLTNKRKILILEERHAQVLLDLEPFLMNLGLGVEIRCFHCRRAGKDALVRGGYNPESGELTMTCACTERKYIGRDLLWPKPPTWSPLAKDRIMIRRDVPLNLWHLSRFEDIDRVLALLKLQYALNCLQCQQDGHDNTVAGSKELELTLTCQCAKRTYNSHAVSASIH